MRHVGVMIFKSLLRRVSKKKSFYTGRIDPDSNHAYSLSANVMDYRYQFGCHINYNEGTLIIACSCAPLAVTNLLNVLRA